jgi:arginine exporter protein ArgO
MPIFSYLRKAKNKMPNRKKTKKLITKEKNSKQLSFCISITVLNTL